MDAPLSPPTVNEMLMALHVVGQPSQQRLLRDIEAIAQEAFVWMGEKQPPPWELQILALGVLAGLVIVEAHKERGGSGRA